MPADVLNEHLIWNFPHVQIFGQNLTLSLRSLTNERISISLKLLGADLKTANILSLRYSQLQFRDLRTLT